MKNNKYFTPDIEDIHVGYELEWKCLTRKQDWEKTVCDVDLMSIIYDQFEHADEEEPFEEQFRVPYLTKEQIEAEGWKHTGGKLISGANQLYEKKEKYSPVIIYSTDNRKIKIEDSEGNTLLETVECKDINTFRKIIKLLGI